MPIRVASDMQAPLLGASVDVSEQGRTRRVSINAMGNGRVLSSSTHAPGLDTIEGRAVTVSFLKRFTAEHATSALKAAATNQAIPWLESKIRMAEQELSLGSASNAGTETRDLGRSLFVRYKNGQLSEEEYNERRDAHAIAAQQRSNKEMLQSSLQTLKTDLAKRQKASFLTARDIHKLVIKAACDEPMCRYCELPDSRIAPLWNFRGPAPRIGDGNDPETKLPDFGPADFFLSYNWDTPWDELLDALVTHSDKQEEAGAKPPHYWIDIFAVNQHDAWSCTIADPVAETTCHGCDAVAEDLHDWATADPENPKGFDRVIAFTKKTVMLMEPWDKPRPPTRVWCLFEGNTTIGKGGQLEVVLGRKQRRELQRAIEERFDELENNLSRIDARRAEATVIEDRAAIFEAVEDMDAGFEGLNEAMRAALRRWLAEAAADLVERLRRPLDAAELRSEAEEHGRCAVCCIRCADRWPRLGQASLAAALLVGSLVYFGMAVFLLGIAFPRLTDTIESWLGDDLELVLLGALVSCMALAIICFGVGVALETQQTKHMLRTTPLCGWGFTTRNHDTLTRALFCGGFIVSLPLSAAFGLSGFLFVGGFLGLGAIILGIAGKRGAAIVLKRARFASKAGWVRLRLGETAAAAAVFRSAHEELQLAVGPDKVDSWLAAPGLVRALCLSPMINSAGGDVALEETTALRAQLEAVIARVDTGWRRWRRRLCTQEETKDVAKWQLVRASLAAAAYAPTADVLDMLEQSAAMGCLCSPSVGEQLGPEERKGPCCSMAKAGAAPSANAKVRSIVDDPVWEHFVGKMASGGGASVNERRRWEAYREAAVQNQREHVAAWRTTRTLFNVCVVLVLVVLVVVATNRTACLASGRVFPPVYRGGQVRNAWTDWCVGVPQCRATSDCPLEQYCDSGSDCYDCSYITPGSCDAIARDCCSAEFLANCPENPHGCTNVTREAAGMKQK